MDGEPQCVKGRVRVDQGQSPNETIAWVSMEVLPDINHIQQKILPSTEEKTFILAD